MNRRAFLAMAGLASDAQYTVEAKFYEKLAHKKIKCKLCPRECVIDDRERGYCGVRENRGGTYYTLVHSRVSSAHIDPIEKKRAEKGMKSLKAEGREPKYIATAADGQHRLGTNDVRLIDRVEV